MRRQWGQSVVVLGAMCLACLAGCDDKDNRRSAATSDTHRSGTAKEISSPPPRRSSVPPSQTTPSPSSNTPQERKVRTENGAIVILPPRPTKTSAPPSGDCRRQIIRSNGRIRRILFPPAPGLTARRLGARSVLVTYQFSALDRRCRPAVLELTLDVNDDPLPGTGIVSRIRGLRGTVTVSLPEGFAKADVVRATARTEKGLPSTATAVLIG